MDHGDATVSIAVEPPRQPDAERLLDGSTADAQRLYPPESNFLLDIAALERPEVAFYVARLGAGGARWASPRSSSIPRPRRMPPARAPS